MIDTEVSSSLLLHLQKRLEDAGELSREDPHAEDEGGTEGEGRKDAVSDVKRAARTQKRLRKVEYSPREEVQSEDSEHDGEGHSSSDPSSVKRLLGFFEERLGDPAFDDSEKQRRRRDLYGIFSDAVQRSLMSTKKSENYDDFPELTVLYFITEADHQGYGVDEIESLIREIS